MAKYAALETFLLSDSKSVIRTSFSDIEKIIGQPLPASAKYPAWWSNNPSNNSMTKVWRRAGFKTEQVDVVRKTIVFRRVSPTPPEPPVTEDPKAAPKAAGLAETGRAFRGAHHPLRGALKGVLRLVGGTDLTKPADPEWGGR